MEDNSPPAQSKEQIQIEAVRAAVGPIFQVAADSLKHYLGALSIPVIGGILGAVFAPVAEDIKQCDFSAAPRGLRKFWEGLCACAENAAKVQSETNSEENPVIIP